MLERKNGVKEMCEEGIEEENDRVQLSRCLPLAVYLVIQVIFCFVRELK